MSLELQLCLLARSLNQRLKAPHRERIAALDTNTNGDLASGPAAASAMPVTQRRSMDAWPVCLIPTLTDVQEGRIEVYLLPAKVNQF